VEKNEDDIHHTTLGAIFYHRGILKVRTFLEVISCRPLQDTSRLLH